MNEVTFNYSLKLFQFLINMSTCCDLWTKLKNSSNECAGNSASVTLKTKQKKFKRKPNNFESLDFKSKTPLHSAKGFGCIWQWHVWLSMIFNFLKINENSYRILRVQIMSKVVCISLGANVLGKIMSLSVLFSGYE